MGASKTNLTNNLATILVVDDEAPVLRTLKRNLSGYGYEVLTAADGVEALACVEENRPDLMLLDLNMPRLSGLEVCRRIRKWNQMPIIVLSARGDEQQKVEALDLGADDYLTKPFGMSELLARIRAALRRTGQPAKDETFKEFSLDGFSINFEQHLVTVDGQEVKLTPQQFELLKYLVRNAGRVLTHRSVLVNVWGAEYEDETQYLHVFIGQLRHKIEADPSRPRYILTERGVGYRFRAPG
jgi:two-component system KDP operon response regulator KdpE